MTTIMISENIYFTAMLIAVLSTLDLSCTVALASSPDLPQWTVRDDNNKICMLMAMNATIQYGREILIPSSATASRQTGSCDSKMALFTLEWPSEDGYTYKMTTAFKAEGNSYKMVEVNGTASRGFSFSSWSDKDSSFPSASIGNSMTCQLFDSGTVYFTEYKFQPFAQLSKEQYGKAEACSFGSGLWVYVVFVAIVIIAIAVVAAIVLVIVKVVKSKRRYSEMQ